MRRPRAPFDQDFYIILNAAIGGNYTGCTDPGCITANLPQQFLIDYVRVYEDIDNIAPTVSITSPSPGATVPAGDITINATASDEDGSVVTVEFYNGQTYLGEDSTPPYTFTWTSVADGCYAIVAKAIDDLGGSGTDTVDITVGAGCGQEPYPGTPRICPARFRPAFRSTGSDKSQLVTLAFNSPDPRLATDVVNAVAEEYIGLGVQTRRERTRRAETWLSNQLEELRTRVVESQATLKGFQTREGLIDLSSQRELTGSRLATLDQAVVEAQTRYNELSKRYGPKHPKLIAAAAELTETQERLTGAQRSSVDTQGQSFELARLEQEVATNRELYDLFLARLNETDMSLDETNTSARVLDLAQVPRVPFEPDKQKILGIWTLIGLLTGIVFVFLKEQLDNTLKSPTDAEELLGFPVLGVLPLVTSAKRRRKDKLAPERYYLAGTGSPFVESINHVRTGIVFSNVDHPPKTLLITSAIQGEGKTTLATNLALAFAQLGKTVLVDADLRKPRASQIAGLGDGPGVVDFAVGRSELADCLSSDPDIENLSILRSGSIPPNPLELLSSNRFASAVRSLQDQFSYIVIDAPPVLPVSDAIVLSRLADGVILLIEADRTTKTTVREAKDRLVKSNINPLGLVLSKFNPHKQTHYYGKHSYYYYNNYYTQKDGRRPKRVASA